MKKRFLIYLIGLALVGAWAFWRAQPSPPLVLVVVQPGEVNMDGERIELTRLGEQAAILLERDPARPVQVIVSAREPSGTLIPIMQALEKRGITNVEVLTSP